MFRLIRTAFFCNLKFEKRKALKGLYPQNVERALKSMTYVQIESIHIDGFKNVNKNSKWYSVAMVTNKNPWKGAKNAFTLVKISQVREIVQN